MKTHALFASFAVAMCYATGVTAQSYPTKPIRMIKALANNEVKDRFESQGYEVVGSTAEAFRKWIAEQYEKWGRVIRERKITQN